MSALSILYLVLPFPLAFLLHDMEEMIVQYKWMTTHATSLFHRFPRLRSLLKHLLLMDTKSFAIAVAEEFIVIMGITAYVRSLCPIPMDSPFYGLFPPSADSLHSGYTNTRIYSRTCLLLPSATICRIWCMEYQSRPQCWDIVTVIYCRPAGSNGPSVVQPLVGTSSHRKEITSIPIFRHRNACLPATS